MRSVGGVAPAGMETWPPGTGGRDGSMLRGLWRRLPRPLRRLLYRMSNWTGLPYAAGWFATYRERHQPANFAGNLSRLRRAYARCRGPARGEVERRIEAVIDALVLPNGVRKTTYVGRQNIVLDQVLADEACRPHGPMLRVLDVPASTGIASLACLDRLERDYTVTRYVLGDLSFRILYDLENGCVFDEDGELLQVRSGRGFVSIWQPHAGGNDFSPLTRLLLLPWTVRACWLRRRYPFAGVHDVMAIPLTHPAVEERLADGTLQLARVNVFDDAPGAYDLILCFNLLQRNYFPEPLVARGMETLTEALAEGGVLVVGSPDAGGLSRYLVGRKEGGRLVTVRRTGEF